MKASAPRFPGALDQGRSASMVKTYRPRHPSKRISTCYHPYLIAMRCAISCSRKGEHRQMAS